jgi:hypothetical protein
LLFSTNQGTEQHTSVSCLKIRRTRKSVEIKTRNNATSYSANRDIYGSSYALPTSHQNLTKNHFLFILNKQNVFIGRLNKPSVCDVRNNVDIWLISRKHQFRIQVPYVRSLYAAGQNLTSVKFHVKIYGMGSLTNRRNT